MRAQGGVDHNAMAHYRQTAGGADKPLAHGQAPGQGQHLTTGCGTVKHDCHKGRKKREHRYVTIRMEIANRECEW
ncbi:hypothetical protein GCM10010082_22080 [Kushneria pakistanensis]|uniref:Uncharacterized protein n=1 Tax=Kushneria pakistanensis TaxID=1508770 RepID=A0ABQ3FL16_9GAMM|nr:hypothetical protein GCM10010082_22080 [Kushneria pakistanensis]